MPDPISITLSFIAEKITDALFGKIADKFIDRVEKNSVEKAFQKALAVAIKRYATNKMRLRHAMPLMQEGSPFNDDAIIEEILHILPFDRNPDLSIFASRWESAVDDPPQWCDFTHETEVLFKYLTEELRSTESFRPVFDSGSLYKIATSANTFVELLSKTENQLTSLIDIMSVGFGNLIHTFTRSSFEIHNKIRDYTSFIEEKTYGFVGRKFVFEAIENFIRNSPRGYFFVLGDPGAGKSALAAQIVKNNGYIHHFNIRAEGINKSEDFLRNVCAQLIAVYELDYTSLPLDALQDSFFLRKLLEECSKKISTGEKIVIIVDALDEVSDVGLPPGTNKLYLPMILPKGVYIIVTTRRTEIGLRIDCEQDKLDIKHDSADNIANIHQYLMQNSLGRKGLQDYIAIQGINTQLFVNRMIEKSQGNFMYLYYVLPEIEKGTYKELSIESLPIGLKGYYEDHWQRMGMTKKPIQREKIKIIYIIAEVRQPVSCQLISDFAKEDQITVQEVLDEWQQFLHKKVIDEQVSYNIYHTSFSDFLNRKDIVKHARVTIKGINALIADHLWQGLMGGE